MQVQLICHGMMLFYYRKPTTPGGKDDGYTILLPQAPTGPHAAGHGGHGGHDGHAGHGGPAATSMEHEIRLGVGAGAVNSVLSYPASPEPTKSFKLNFSSKESCKERGPKNALTEFMLFKAGATKAVPNIDKLKPAGVAFTIDIPYPKREEPVRIATYKHDPYLDGDTVRNFEIHPRRIVGARVFTYEIDDASQGIELTDLDTGAVKVIKAGPLTGPVKIHLYSQPTAVVEGSNHLPVFNEMVRVNGRPLDLKLNPGRVEDIDPSHLPRPDGLQVVDTLHLHEIKSSAEQGIDPAECNQGGGC